jgi:hypothetical protein
MQIHDVNMINLVQMTFAILIATRPVVLTHDSENQTRPHRIGEILPELYRLHYLRFKESEDARVALFRSHGRLQ